MEQSLMLKDITIIAGTANCFSASVYLALKVTYCLGAVNVQYSTRLLYIVCFIYPSVCSQPAIRKFVATRPRYRCHHNTCHYVKCRILFQRVCTVHGLLVKRLQPKILEDLSSSVPSLQYESKHHSFILLYKIFFLVFQLSCFSLPEPMLS